MAWCTTRTREVTVTFGATEAVAAAILALCDGGDEVVVLEPVYDAYTAVIAMAGAVEVRVPLSPPGAAEDGADGSRTARGAWHLDVERFAAAVTPRTRLVLLNSPHNPTGAVLSDAELDAIAEVCVDNDLLAVTDEVYEHLVYEGSHRPLATRTGMRGAHRSRSRPRARPSRAPGGRSGGRAPRCR